MNVFASLVTTKTPPASVAAQLLVVLPAHTMLQIITLPVSLATLRCLELSAQITSLAFVSMATTRRLQYANPAPLAVFPALSMEQILFAVAATPHYRELWALLILPVTV